MTAVQALQDEGARMSESLLPDDLVSLAERVVAENRAEGRKVTVAESCTGGLVTAALTEVPGCSAVLDRGFVVYSNEAKLEELGVAPDIIDTFGAVSIANCWAMAQGALEHSHADVAVALTGITGPTGGTEQKPVGTVVFARAVRGAGPEDAVTDLQHFSPTASRAQIRRQAALVALEMLLP